MVTKNDNTVLLKTGQVVKYRDGDKGILLTAKLLGRAGKATGKHKNWHNMLLVEPTDVAGVTRSTDLSNENCLQIEYTVTTIDTDSEDAVYW